MTEFIISSEQLERIIESVEHNTGREINRVVIDGVGVQEIVRCRDCKWYLQANSATGWNDVCNLTDSNVQSNGFCAWGEQREGAES